MGIHSDGLGRICHFHAKTAHSALRKFKSMDIGTAFAVLNGHLHNDSWKSLPVSGCEQFSFVPVDVKMIGKTVDWKKLWCDFSEWLSELEDIPGCKECGSMNSCFPEWDEQEAKIQKLVDAQVRKLVEKKT